MMAEVRGAGTAKLVKELSITPDIATVRFSPDGRWLVVGEFDKYQFLEVGTLVNGLSLPRIAVFVPTMAFPPGGRVLAGLGFP